MKVFDGRGLTEDEKKRLDEFICLSAMQATSVHDQQLAFRCLAARKFSVAQALELYHNYQAMLSRENIPETVDPFDEDVRQELLSGKFVILNDHELAGARVAQLFVRLHRSSCNNRTLLKSILFQLNATFRRDSAVRNGLVFIYDMTGVRFANVDCAFGIKLFKILKFSYPVRLRRILILTAPLWFRASFRMMRVFIRDELRDVVSVLRPAPGTKLNALSHPDFVVLKREHYAWLQTALTRTGWVLAETSDQISKPNSAGPRPQSVAAFFGHHSPLINQSGSPSDNTAAQDSGQLEDEDPESDLCDEDRSQCSTGPLPDDEDLLSEAGDVDPFALSSSYSSETEAQSPDNLSDSVPHSDHSTKRRKNHVGTTTQPNPRSPSPIFMSNPRSDHAETPTPPSVAKRLALPIGNLPTSESHNPLSSTTTSTVDQDPGFVENPSPSFGTESVTPTTDTADSAALRGSVRPHSHGSSQRDSAYPESLCTSSTCVAFFSTGATSLSPTGSTKSVECNPVGEVLSPQRYLTTLSVPGLRTIKRPDLFSVVDTTLILGNTNTSSSSSRPRVAPLAQDEIDDPPGRLGGGCSPNADIEPTVTEEPVATHPPTENNLPDWAFGRPYGPSVHSGYWPSSTLQAVGNDKADSRATGIEDSRAVRGITDPMTASLLERDGESQQLEYELESLSEDAEMEDDSDKCDDDDDEDDIDDDNGQGHDPLHMEDYWMTPMEIAEHAERSGLTGIYAEYNAVIRSKCDDPRSAFKHIDNREKNRYCDVICYESSRVRLRPTTVPFRLCAPGSINPKPLRAASKAATQLHRTASAPAASKDLVRNYIHANWVDGYRQKNAFICTQGPLFETAGDFWQMIWDYHVPVIVMITKVVEADRVKCFPYWPDSTRRKVYFTSGYPGYVPVPTSGQENSSSSGNADTSPDFAVELEGSQSSEHYNCSTFRLVNLKTKQYRTVHHYAYFSWPDHGVPQTTDGLIQLLSSVQSSYAEAIGKLGYTNYMEQSVPPPPVVVHCSAGIGRTGTYVTADICTKWLTDPTANRIINIPLTVSRVRAQRYGCVQVAPQYAFCYRVVLDFSVQQGLLDPVVARDALATLTPPLSVVNPFCTSSTTSSFYHSNSSTSSLPRSCHSRSPLVGFSNPSSLLDTDLNRGRASRGIAQFLSLWNAMRTKRVVTSGDDVESNGDPPVLFDDADFVMTENMCSSDSSEECSPTASIKHSPGCSPDSQGLPSEIPTAPSLQDSQMHPGLEAGNSDNLPEQSVSSELDLRTSDIREFDMEVVCSSNSS